MDYLIEIKTSLTNRLSEEVKALPIGFNKDRFILNCIEVLKNTKLSDIPPERVINALMKGAYLGLDFFRKECYCIPFGKSVEFMMDYKGEVKLVKKHSIKPIYEIYAEVVREGDAYEKVIVQGHRTVNHKPLRFNNGKIEGAYAHVKYSDGSTDMVDISVQDIENIRYKYSKAPHSGAWENRYEEMCKKTVLRLLCKSIQLDFSTEQYLAYQEGGDCEFDKNPKTEEIALNPFDNTTNNVIEQASEPQVVDAEVVVTPSTSVETAEEPQEELKCYECGATISEKVYTFSVDKFKRPLCYKCQKKGN